MVYVRNIVIFMVFAELLLNIVPKNDYRRYLRLYMGIVLVILVIRPLNSIFDFDYVIDSFYEMYDYKNETEELKRQLEFLEEEEEIYMKAAEEGISRIIEREGMSLVECSMLKRKREGDTEYYGADIIVVPSAGGHAGDDTDGSHQDAVTGSVSIDKVVIGGGGTDDGRIPADAPVSEDQPADSVDKAYLEKISAIKNSISEVYNFDVNNINISIRG